MRARKQSTNPRSHAELETGIASGRWREVVITPSWKCPPENACEAKTSAQSTTETQDDDATKYDGDHKQLGKAESGEKCEPWREQHSRFCLTSKMSHAYGWRGSCAAGDVTAVGVGSGALLGRLGFKTICLRPP